MSCYNPKVMLAVVDPDTGAISYRFRHGSNARYDGPKQLLSYDELDINGKYEFYVPCGKCLGCRADYTRIWADRMVLELEDNPKALMITLTYRDDELTYAPNGEKSLNKDDVTRWLKRLRKHLAPQRIRYYLAGEYGPKTERPHYHAILYGVSVEDIGDLTYLYTNKDLGYAVYTSPTWERIWSHGFVSMTAVTAKTCNYVARYVLKKQFDMDNDGPQPDDGRIRCYNVSSRKPGIGMAACERMLNDGIAQITHVDSSGARVVNLPSKVVQRLHERAVKNEDMELLAICAEWRHNMQIRTQQATIDAVGDQNYADYLLQQRLEKQRSLRILPQRNF